MTAADTSDRGSRRPGKLTRQATWALTLGLGLTLTPWSGASAQPPTSETPTAPPTLAPKDKATEDAAARAADPEAHPKTGFRYQNVTVFRLNPLGLIDQGKIGLRHMLFDSDSILLKPAYAELAFAPSVSPAFTRLGARLEVSPLAILRLAAMYEYARFFGTFDTITSYNSPNASYSDSDQDDLGAAGLNYGTSGHLVTLDGLLQARVGKVAVRFNLRAQYNDMDLENGDTSWYDILFDVMQADESWMLSLDSDLFYQFNQGKGLTLGVRHSWIKAIYPDSAFAAPDDTPQNLNTPMNRVGPVLIYRMDHAAGDFVRQPTVFLITQWWLDHRWRTGDDVSQGVPYVLLGYAFNGWL